VKNKNEEKAAEDCDKLFKFLDGYLKSASIALKLLGPAAAYIPKLHNTYRRHIIVKGFKDDILGLASFASGYSKKFQDTKISVEIMPSDLI
jgi:primosomal protein N' (replication factor Y)